MDGVHVGKIRKALHILFTRLEEKIHLKDPSIDRRIAMKWSVRKLNVRVCLNSSDSGQSQ
jgi:hypothetical protein